MLVRNPTSGYERTRDFRILLFISIIQKQHVRSLQKTLT